MTQFNNLAIRNAILCEDVRVEVGNKKTLVGVYGGDILISDLPGALDIAFYFDGRAKVREPIEIEIKLSGPGKGQAIGRIELEAPGENLAVSLVSPKMQVVMDTEGTFKIALRDPGQNWKTVISKKVILKPDLSSA